MDIVGPLAAAHEYTQSKVESVTVNVCESGLTADPSVHVDVFTRFPSSTEVVS
jgi:hypothetical protein